MGCYSSKAVRNVHGSEFNSNVAIPRPWCGPVTSGNICEKLSTSKERERSPTEIRIKSQLSSLPTFTTGTVSGELMEDHWRTKGRRTASMRGTPHSARQAAAAGNYLPVLRTSRLRKGIRLNDAYKLGKTMGTGGERWDRR